jgi:hypothetical protein
MNIAAQWEEYSNTSSGQKILTNIYKYTLTDRLTHYFPTAMIHSSIYASTLIYGFYISSSSFLGSTAQFRPWPSPQNLAEFLGTFSTIFFFTG